MDTATETIAAIATPPGRGGVGIVRVSGPKTQSIAAALCGDMPPPRKAVLRRFCDSERNVIDEGLALFFPAPNSFTGEDIFELHGHGGAVVLDMLLQRVLELGARAAEPGEFSKRAFLNDKLDLAQAEAIADLIDSGSVQAARAALRSLRGDFSAAVHELTAALTELRMYVEAAIDFPEEEVDFLGDNEIQTRLKDIKEKFSTLDSKASQGALMHDGLTVVIAGKPNAGKSSLLNKLAGYDAAIVTDIPGTTRDLLREKMHIDGLPLHIIDTAGLRDSGDAIEVEGQRRARAEMEQADRVLLVVDDSIKNEEVNPSALHAFPESLPVTVVRNKIDLSGQAAGELPGNANSQFAISAKTGAGLAQLRQHLKDAVGYQQAGSDTFMARRRHLDALRKAREHVRQGEHALQNAKAGELLAEELRLAQRDLSEITGEFSSDDLLGQIFSSFCIGK